MKPIIFRHTKHGTEHGFDIILFSRPIVGEWRGYKTITPRHAFRICFGFGLCYGFYWWAVWRFGSGTVHGADGMIGQERGANG